jgi:hypothetical protein
MSEETERVIVHICKACLDGAPEPDDECHTPGCLFCFRESPRAIRDLTEPAPEAPAEAGEEAKSELLPCPFCGSKADFGSLEGDPELPEAGGEFIECSNKVCQATTCLIYSIKDDARLQLTEIWNRRIRPTPAKGLAIAARRDSRPACSDEVSRSPTLPPAPHTAAVKRRGQRFTKGKQ